MSLRGHFVQNIRVVGKSACVCVRAPTKSRKKTMQKFKFFIHTHICLKFQCRTTCTCTRARTSSVPRLTLYLLPARFGEKRSTSRRNLVDSGAGVKTHASSS